MPRRSDLTAGENGDLEPVRREAGGGIAQRIIDAISEGYTIDRSPPATLDL